MARRGDPAIPTAYDEVVAPRRRRLLTLRGVYGVSYGIGAYGSPIGAVAGVQTPVPPPDAQPVLGEQFGDGGGLMGDGGGSGDGGAP